MTRPVYPLRRRQVGVGFYQGEPALVEVGDLVACVPQFEVLPGMETWTLPNLHGRAFVPLTTAWQWAERFRNRGRKVQYQALVELLAWAEMQEQGAARSWY